MLIFNKDKWLEDVCMRCVKTITDPFTDKERKADAAEELYFYARQYNKKDTWINIINGKEVTHNRNGVGYVKTDGPNPYMVLDEWCIEKE